jgi:hypothetical protein
MRTWEHLKAGSTGYVALLQLDKENINKVELVNKTFYCLEEINKIQIFIRSFYLFNNIFYSSPPPQ